MICAKQKTVSQIDNIKNKCNLKRLQIFGGENLRDLNEGNTSHCEAGNRRTTPGIFYWCVFGIGKNRGVLISP
jgi:hypothetical protein